LNSNLLFIRRGGLRGRRTRAGLLLREEVAVQVGIFVVVGVRVGGVVLVGVK